MQDIVAAHDAAHWQNKAPRVAAYRERIAVCYCVKTKMLGSTCAHTNDNPSTDIVDLIYDGTPIVPSHDNGLQPGSYTVYDHDSGDLIIADVSLNTAMMMRKYMHTELAQTVDIIETQTISSAGYSLFDGFGSSFEHDASQHSVETPKFLGAPDPEPPLHDWKKLLTAAKAKRNFIHKTKVHETRISGFVNEDDHYDYLNRKGYSVIDVRTLEIVGSGSESDCRSFIKQRDARRLDYVYNYRVIRFSERDGYLSRIAASGWALRYLGEIICIGTKEDMKNYLQLRHIPDLKDNGRVEPLNIKIKQTWKMRRVSSDFACL